jgi:hypothetical protein
MSVDCIVADESFVGFHINKEFEFYLILSVLRINYGLQHHNLCVYLLNGLNPVYVTSMVQLYDKFKCLTVSLKRESVPI